MMCVLYLLDGCQVRSTAVIRIKLIYLRGKNNNNNK